MNTIVTLTDGREVDACEVQGFSFDCWFDTPGNGKITMKDGTIHENVHITDLEAIDMFRRELKEIKHGH